MTIISDLAGSLILSWGFQGIENIVAIIKMRVVRVFLRGLLVNGEMVGYYILFSNDVMRQFCKCSWTFWKACFLPKEKNHLLFFYGMLLT